MTLAILYYNIVIYLYYLNFLIIMKNEYIFFLSDSLDLNFSYLILFLLILFSASIINDKYSSFFEKFWTKIDQRIYKAEERRDSFFDNSDISSGNNSDQGLIQLVTQTKIKFEDVAGNEEAKQELKEVVTFLKNPTKFAKLGASVPKGILLGGPPGTGKTLFAKAIAGEANTPFLQVSGSQFVELLVGMGASRVRELFEKARSLKPCIIFIDEIDSIARARSVNNNMGGGANDEREQTLNQILTEMDGFESETGILVIGATNRVDILDPAITRPGRFDRQIIISNPTLTERQAILQVHAREKKLDSSISFLQIALRTVGFSGADLANLLNEAAILAARRKKTSISMDEVNESIEKVAFGLKGRASKRLKVRQTVAFYEIGHAFLGLLLFDNIEKVSIVPRGNKQSNTLTIPAASRYPSREFLINQILVSLGGKACEDILNGVSESTVTSQRDISQLTRILRALITRYAMSRLQELKQENQKRNLSFLGSDIKQEFNNSIDEFTTKFIDILYKELLYFLRISRPIIERIADELLKVEELSGTKLRSLTNEYFSPKEMPDYLEKTRQSAFYQLLLPELKIIRKNKKSQVKYIQKLIKKLKDLKKNSKNKNSKNDY